MYMGKQSKTTKKQSNDGHVQVQVWERDQPYVKKQYRLCSSVCLTWLSLESIVVGAYEYVMVVKE
jgi:hypothetical protein